MEKKTGEFKKYLILIIVAIVGYWTINNLRIVGNLLSNILNIIFPFVLGGCLAFILNIPMTFFEKKLSNSRKKKTKKEKNKKLIIIFSIIFAIIVILFIFTLIFKLIVPELVNIVNLLIDNIPYLLALVLLI